jgi:hypothetical protein
MRPHHNFRRMDIDEIISNIAGNPHCSVVPPHGVPIVSSGHILPDDLKDFYSRAGGASLFLSSAYGLSIVGPDEVVPANP